LASLLTGFAFSHDGFDGASCGATIEKSEVNVMDYWQVSSQLLFGAHPRRPRDVDQLAREKGVTAVLNLQTDEDIANLAIDWETILSRYAGVGIDLHRVPIRDFDAKSLELHLPAAVGCLARLLQQGHTVLVHCNAGAGRSPSVVVAYLHWVEGWDLLEAEAFLQSCRPCSPDLNAIRAASDRWPPEESDPAGPETGQ